MIAIDPDVLDIQIDADIIEDDSAESGYSIKSNWSMRVPEQGGTAWIRLTPQLRDFFLLCQEKHGVVGFDYDFEDGGLNFGLILKGDDQDANQQMEEVVDTESGTPKPEVS